MQANRSDIVPGTSARNNLVPYDGELFHSEPFYRQEEADRLFSSLMIDLCWREEDIFIHGRMVKVPRLMCWYGDPGACYSYSGVKHEPLPWNETLLAIKGAVEQAAGHDFNSVLANLYRDGNDSMGYHADKEKELGKNPVIASLSLGAERLFRVIHNKTRYQLDLMLRHGDLLVMAGSLQHHWRHAVPKTRKAGSARINLTFRKIIFG